MGLVDGLAADEIGRGQRTGERRDRLDRAANDQRLAIRDAAGQAAGVVRAVDPAAAFAASRDHVVHATRGGRHDQVNWLARKRTLSMSIAENGSVRRSQCRNKNLTPVHGYFTNSSVNRPS